jgi:transcriptional regulator with XRE-family HTH domain
MFSMLLTASQIRAARALLEWSQPQLAEAAGLSMMSIRRMEGPSGPGQRSAGNVEAVRKALDDAGVIFISADDAAGPGVRLKK